MGIIAGKESRRGQPTIMNGGQFDSSFSFSCAQSCSVDDTSGLKMAILQIFFCRAQSISFGNGLTLMGFTDQFSDSKVEAWLCC